MSLYSTHSIGIKNITIKSLPESIVYSDLPEEESAAAGEAPQCICKRGSFTMEAAVIFPLMACLFTFLLFFFRIMQTELAVQDALEHTGRNLALLSVMEKEEEEASLEYLVAAKGFLYQKLKAETNIEQFVEGGALGISLLTSDFSDDYIFLKAEYLMKFPVGLLGKYTFWIHQQTRFRKWTGYHPVETAEGEDTWVYITETGSVYHQSEDCPYLKLSISAVSLAEVEAMRNKSGQKYEVCSLCEKKFSNAATVYVTDYGDKYHYDLGCSGLKRTIYKIRLSEAEERRACSKCWN